MKKNKRFLLFAVLPLALITAVSFFAFTPHSERAVKPNSSAVKFKSTAGCNPSTTTDLANGCPYSCSGIWIVNNINIYKSGSNVTFNTLYYCFWNTGTPPWTSYTYLGTLSSTYRPASTKTFTAYDPNGGPIQCTIYANGDWYIQHTGSTLPSGSACVMSGAYTL